VHTYLLSDDDIRRYGLDLIDRWRSLGDDAPRQWFSLGISGDKMARTLYGLLTPAEQEELEFRRLLFDRSARRVIVRDDETFPDFSADAKVFLIDSAIHSGASMRAVAGDLSRRGAWVMSYGLVMKRTSEFVPSFFGLLIDEHDRALFQLDKLPNNRLKKARPFGHLRLIRAEDADIPTTLETNVASIRKISFGDLYYEHHVHGALVYLYEEAGEIRGYIQFSHANGTLSIDTILADDRHRGTGIGGALMRWAETYARSNRCKAMALWAIEDQREFYERYRFEIVDPEPQHFGDGERYYRMSKRVLYNVKPQELVE